MKEILFTSIFGLIFTAVFAQSSEILPNSGGFKTNGVNQVGKFENTNTANASIIVEIKNSGTNNALSVQNLGTGKAGYFTTANATNITPTLSSLQEGLGKAAEFIIQNSVNNNTALNVSTNGLGQTASFAQANVLSTAVTMKATNAGSGTVIWGENTGKGGAGSFSIQNPLNDFTSLTSNTNGLGPAGYFAINNLSNTLPSLISYTKGSGNALESSTIGGGSAGLFTIVNASNNSPALRSTTNGSGSVAQFILSNTSNTNDALFVETPGSGNGLKINYGGNKANPTPTERNVAIFQTTSTNVARIDAAGKGFFNGGTQSSGADIAEAFDIIGEANQYEPGDVLVISINQDRTVEKSSLPYSSLVAGVYATKPGVLLTEENIDTDISNKVPMGVIGVIPTKVCSEGGSIKRGDLLVTSSKAGYAMKADRSKLEFGQIIGKALQDFDGNEGKIKVLVSLK